MPAQEQEAAPHGRAEPAAAASTTKQEDEKLKAPSKVTAQEQRHQQELDEEPEQPTQPDKLALSAETGKWAKASVKVRAKVKAEVQAAADDALDINPHTNTPMDGEANGSLEELLDKHGLR